MKQLFVYFENHKVGTLTKDDQDVYSFSYDDAWLSNSERFSISFSMPLKTEAFGNRVTLAFFENLLPEGDVRWELERSHNIRGTFEFLEKFGRDCAGAIVVRPVDVPPDIHHEEEDLHPISLDEIYQAVDEHRSVMDVIAQAAPGYLSLAGAQDKFPCVLKGTEFFLPLKGSPTTHIVKAPIWRNGVKESVFNEYAVMELARKVNLEVPHHVILDGPHPLYVIERYDRQRNLSGQLHRLHQQDLCQAKGIPSEEKYEAKGGPTLADIYRFLLAHISPSHRFVALERFLAWVAFNLIIGNNDSHAKNLSILMGPQHSHRLAPFYDLLSTAVYGRLKQTFAFKIGDRSEFSKIGRTQVKDLETQLDLKAGIFREKLQETAQKIEVELPSLFQTLSSTWPNVGIFEKIDGLTQKRLKSLRFQGALD